MDLYKYTVQLFLDILNRQDYDLKCTKKIKARFNELLSGCNIKVVILNNKLIAEDNGEYDLRLVDDFLYYTINMITLDYKIKWSEEQQEMKLLDTLLLFNLNVITVKNSGFTFYEIKHPEDNEY